MNFFDLNLVWKLHIIFRQTAELTTSSLVKLFYAVIRSLIFAIFLMTPTRQICRNRSIIDGTVLREIPVDPLQSSL